MKVTIPDEMAKYLTRLCEKNQWLGTVEDFVLTAVRERMEKVVNKK